MIPLARTAGSNNPGAARAPTAAGIASMRRRGARGGRRRARGAAPPALVAALVAAASVGRAPAAAQECTTVNAADESGSAGDCDAFIASGSSCTADYVHGGTDAGL